MLPRILSTTAIKRHMRKAILATTIVSLPLGTTIPVFADTNTSAPSPTAVASLASQIVSYSDKVHNDPLVSSIAAPIIKIAADASFDWNQVLFGTDQLSTSQSKTAQALIPDVRSMATFNVTDEASAMTLIQGIASQMESLNPNITGDQAVAFIQSLQQQALSSMIPLAAKQSVTSQDVISAFHTAFSNDIAGSAAPVQTLFTGNGNDSATGSTQGSAGGTTSSSGTGLGSTTPITSTTPLAGVSTVVKDVSLDSTGGTFTADLGNGDTLNITVPSGAFTGNTDLSISSVNPGALANFQTTYQLPAGMVISFGFGIHFIGTSQETLKVALSGSDVTDSAQLYAVTDSGLNLVNSTETTGVMTFTVTQASDYVILKSTKVKGSQGASGDIGTQQPTSTNQNSSGTSTKQPTATATSRRAVISVNGKGAATVSNYVVKNGTVYMPIWYVMQALKEIGVTSKWNGQNWFFTLQTNNRPVLTKIQPGKGTMSIYLNGTLVQHVTGVSTVDVSTGSPTTYMPIWYVIQVLKRVGIQSTWNGTTWAFTSEK